MYYRDVIKILIYTSTLFDVNDRESSGIYSTHLTATQGHLHDYCNHVVKPLDKI